MQTLKLFLKSGWLVIAFSFVAFFVTPSPTFAQSPSLTINNTYQVGTVTEVTDETQVVIDGSKYYVQVVTVKSNQDGSLHQITYGDQFQPLNENQRLHLGSQVVISNQQLGPQTTQFVISDLYRLPILGILGFLFLILVIMIGRRQGTLSIAGMFLSLYILIAFIVPHILAGENPFWITLLGASVTAIVSMYLSHGFKRQTHIALVSMLLCLAAVAVLSSAAVRIGQFVGLGSEEAAYLNIGATQKINLRGLLLAGIMLGALGILDDITLAQTSVIEQLKDLHPKITFDELYRRGLEVGKDHVASLVNTLVFAYAGTSLPLFLLFTLYRTQPLWVILNSEVVAEEVVRTLVGSIGLVMAVPITTAIASYCVSGAIFSEPKKT